jgi:hypothetical protein
MSLAGQVPAGKKWDEGQEIRDTRYIELNPVRAGLVEQAADWAWSSGRSHLSRGEDLLLAGASWPLRVCILNGRKSSLNPRLRKF